MSTRLGFCAECGMEVEKGEYHPYAACLMFNACNNGRTVRENLSGVLKHGREDQPLEILDLVVFLAETWKDVDKFVYEHCNGDALMEYPVIQGTSNQINLGKIGSQQYSKENLHRL